MVELAAGSIDTFNALTRAHIPVGVWGHVDDYVSKGSFAGRAIKKWQVRRAHAVLAYTASGADTARRWGARADGVFTLNNTVDLSSLQRAIDQRSALPTVDEADRARTFSYIGGLDASKRIDLVADALEILWNSGSSVRLLVAGSGKQRDLLHPAQERGQVVLMGRADDAIKADMAARSVALLNPGRVGLLAVESPVLGLPIITTNGARHAPEFEYLTPGANAVVTQASGHALADSLARGATDPLYLSQLQQRLREIAGQPPLSAMVDSFVSGIEHMLRSSVRRDG
ncbi:glycosyltransferase [Curtobacterium sp. Csp2]|uniref:glycosyltransferase n=1 Tax=Curtobacterium sp. Csp2 TaxID=2495430 RepID=UPI0015807CD2|nr:glycosyltransferase [Curtobacterium sp. Csp2]QKS17544.1 glycosyltransferase [Curtobacterium sp. Csp2]